VTVAVRSRLRTCYGMVDCLTTSTIIGGSARLKIGRGSNIGQRSLSARHIQWWTRNSVMGGVGLSWSCIISRHVNAVAV